MHQFAQLLALAATISTASAGTVQGFNYGSTKHDNSAMEQSDFETSFTTAQKLDGTSGAFTSARLYTMIQGGTTSDVISAIPAAIKTKTSLLFGLWASGNGFDNEITALKAAISQYGSQLSDICVGISVGSEDLYRVTPTSIQNGGGVGTNPEVLAGYIKQVKSVISGGPLANCPIGHVDTWNAWTNSTSNQVITELDWLGLDEYPYWQLTDDNGIDNAASLFTQAWDATKGVAQGKDIWMTESGWAVSGPTENKATAGTSEAKKYWDAVGCDMLFGQVNTWWYTLSETGASPDFSISDSTSNTTPLFNLTCSAVANSTTTSGNGSSGSSTISSSGSSSTGTGSSGSGSTGSGSNTTVANATLSTAVSSKTASATGTGSTGAGATGSGAMANSASIGGLLAAVALAVFAL